MSQKFKERECWASDRGIKNLRENNSIQWDAFAQECGDHNKNRIWVRFEQEERKVTITEKDFDKILIFRKR